MTQYLYFKNKKGWFSDCRLIDLINLHNKELIIVKEKGHKRSPIQNKNQKNGYYRN